MSKVNKISLIGNCIPWDMNQAQVLVDIYQFATSVVLLTTRTPKFVRWLQVHVTISVSELSSTIEHPLLDQSPTAKSKCTQDGTA